MKDITANDFEKEVLKVKGVVLVDFNADWCGPCRMFKPILGVVAKQHPEVKVVGVNIDDNEELAEEFGVGTIPCLVVFRDGKEVVREEGVIPEKKILKLAGIK